MGTSDRFLLLLRLDFQLKFHQFGRKEPEEKEEEGEKLITPSRGTDKGANRGGDRNPRRSRDMEGLMNR